MNWPHGESSCLCKPKGKRLNTAAVKPTALPCVRHVWCRLKFPPSREAITAALIVCDTSFWSSYQHPKLATSLPAHSIHKLKLWQDETNMQCHESSKLLVSTLSFQSVSKFNWSYLHSELIGEFDDECPRSLLVKISDEADSSSPLQSIDWKLKNSRKGWTTFETDPKPLVSGASRA